jgi:hypothetical protein
MEETDVFAQSTEDDPFAGSDFGDFEQQEPAPAAAPQQDIPTVNREGERIDTPPAFGLPTLTPEQQAAEGAAYREATGEPEPTPAPAQEAVAEDTTLPAEPVHHAPQDGASVESQEGEAAPAPEQAPEAALQPAERVPAAVGEPATTFDGEQHDGPQIEQPVQPEPEAAAAKVEEALQPSESSSGEEFAAPPAEKKDKGGKVTKRQYVLLQQTGQDTFKQLAWHEDKEGKLLARGSGKRQRVVLARGTEDALKFGYAVVGAPQEGSTLVAVAASLFQPKKVKPLPPEPMKQRLQIG